MTGTPPGMPVFSARYQNPPRLISMNTPSTVHIPSSNRMEELLVLRISRMRHYFRHGKLPFPDPLPCSSHNPEYTKEEQSIMAAFLLFARSLGRC